MVTTISTLFMIISWVAIDHFLVAIPLDRSLAEQLATTHGPSAGRAATSHQSPKGSVDGAGKTPPARASGHTISVTTSSLPRE